MAGIMGKYYSELLSTVNQDEDLIDKIETSLGLSNILIKKLTLICATPITVDINNLGVYSDLWMDIDGYCKLTLSADDVAVYSLKVKESSVTDIFLAVVFAG